MDGVSAFLLPCSNLLLVLAIGCVQLKARGQGSPLIWSVKVSLEGPGAGYKSDLEEQEENIQHIPTSESLGSGGGPHPPHALMILSDHLSTDHLELAFILC